MSSLPFRLSLLLIAIACFASGNDYSNHPYYYHRDYTVREGEGFLLFVTHGQNETGCKVQRNDKEYDLLNYGDQFTANGEYLVHLRIEGECAVRVQGVKKTSLGPWQVVNSVGRYQKANIKVSPAESECPRNNPALDCELTNLDTLETRRCNEDVSDWTSQYKCEYEVKGALEYKVEILPKKSKLIGTTNFHPVEETSTNYVLQCETELNEPLVRCTAYHPRSGRVYNIEDGLLHGRYSSYRTNLMKGLCQFEIQKNGKESDSDAGRWQLRTKDLDGESQQCNFIITTPGAKEKREVPGSKPAENKLQGTTIDCAENARHFIHRCYIRSPDLEIEMSSKCEFTLDKVGEWVCGYNAETTADPDIQQKFIVFDNEAIYPKMDTNQRTLACHHIYKESLKTCMFVSPDNVPFSVPSEHFSSKLYSYFGGHLADGDCGIQFASSNDLKEGTWTCIIETYSSAKYLSVDIVPDGNDNEVYEEQEENDKDNDFRRDDRKITTTTAATTGGWWRVK